VSVLVVTQSSSEIPEGLMNNPVCVSKINLTQFYFWGPFSYYIGQWDRDFTYSVWACSLSDVAQASNVISMASV